MVLWLLLASLAGSPAARAGDTPAAGREEPAELQKLLEDLRTLLASSKTPGMSLALIANGEVRFAGGFGWANVAEERLATAETLFRIGSTSKAFVALAALKLKAEGRLDLNATLASLAPEIAFENRWESTDPVRVIHLLEHTTGFDDMSLRDYANNDARPRNLLDALAYTPATRVSRWRPGTRYAYCNSGPPIVAFIIEKITGEVFEDYVQREFFAPIGMRTATYFEPPAEIDAALMYAPDGITPYDYWHISVRPSGAINASAHDMAAYVRFLLARGRVGATTLIDAVEMEGMERPRSTTAARAGLAFGYGLYNQSSSDEDGRVWQGHGGGVQGGRCDLRYLPGTGLGYALMTNSSDDVMLGRASGLVRRFLTRDLPGPEKPAVVPLPDDMAARYAGFYLPVNPRVKLKGIVDRVAAVWHLRVEQEDVRFDPLFGRAPEFVGVTERLLRQKNRAAPGMVLLAPTEKDAAHLVAHGLSFQRVPAVVALAPLALFLTAGLAMAGTLAFLPVWLVRGIRGRIPLRARLDLRLWPLAVTIALIAYFAGVVDLLSDPRVFQNYGRFTPRSFALAASGIVAAVLACTGLVAVWRRGRSPANRWLKIHARSTLSLLAALTLYLVVAGALPLLSWR